MRLHVRFGSKADVCNAKANVRFGPKADMPFSVAGLGSCNALSLSIGGTNETARAPYPACRASPPSGLVLLERPGQRGCLPMNIDAIRRIDRYVGVPLCAIATPLVRLWHMAFARAAGSAPRVLFIEMSEMGSTILAAPAM
jgi:hypothetical protein